jgi:hypothetical protein
VLYFVPFYVNANLGIAYGARNLGTLRDAYMDINMKV